MPRVKIESLAAQRSTTSSALPASNQGPVVC